LLVRGRGRSTSCEEFVLRPSDRDPNGPHSANDFFQRAKLLQFVQKFIYETIY